MRVDERFGNQIPFCIERQRRLAFQRRRERGDLPPLDSDINSFGLAAQLRALDQNIKVCGHLVISWSCIDLI